MLGSAGGQRGGGRAREGYLRRGRRGLRSHALRHGPRARARRATLPVPGSTLASSDAVASTRPRSPSWPLGIGGRRGLAGRLGRGRAARARRVRQRVGSRLQRRSHPARRVRRLSGPRVHSRNERQLRSARARHDRLRAVDGRLGPREVWGIAAALLLAAAAAVVRPHPRSRSRSRRGRLAEPALPSRHGS